MATLFPDVVVNGTTIPSAAIAAEAQNHSAPTGKPGIAWRKAANALAVRTLMLQEAERRGLSADPQEIAPGKFETPEEALIRALLDKAVAAAPPAAEEVEAEWARDPDRFRAPPLWEVSHILVSCDPTDETARQTAQARAVDLTGRIAGDPRAFARVAKDESDCASKAQGGALGQIGPGDTVPEFESVLRGLSDGEITAEPILSRHGWHIIRLDAVAEGAVLPFETVAPRIAEALEKAAWTRAVRDFVADLVANAEITGADPSRPL